MTEPTPEPIRLSARPRPQRPEVTRNIWFASVSHMEDHGEHWWRRRSPYRLGIAGPRDWLDQITWARAVAVAAVVVIILVVLR